MRVKCLAQEHNSVSPARARTRAARSGNERINYETTDNASNVQCKNRYREQKNKLPAKTYPSPVFLVRKSSDYKTNLHQKMQKGYTIWTESSQRIETTSRRLSFEMFRDIRQFYQSKQTRPPSRCSPGIGKKWIPRFIGRSIKCYSPMIKAPPQVFRSASLYR